MAKILNIRERVHQPYRDALVRSAGFAPGRLASSNDLFIQQGRDEGFSNLKTSAVLPNDSSMIILAARVLQWFRAPVIRTFNLGTGLPVTNGDIGDTVAAGGWTFPNGAGQPAIGNAVGNG